MVNRNSIGYSIGRFVGRVTLIVLGYLGYIIGKKYGQKPIDKSFPEKIDKLNKK
jgi:hypothetical protein